MNFGRTFLLAGLAAAVLFFPGCAWIANLNATPMPEPTPLPTLPPMPEPTATPEAKEIVQVLPYVGFDPNTDPIAARLAQITGYRLSYVVLPQTGATEQLGIELSVGFDYDLLTLTPAQFLFLIGKEKLCALDDWMAQYAPALRAVFSDQEWDAASVNGRIHGIPRYEPAFVSEALALDRTVADELELTVPRTPEELRDVLGTVKKETGMIPLTGSGYRLAPVMSGFGLGAEWIVSPNMLTNWIQTDEFKAYLRFMAELYGEGLLDPAWGDNSPQSAAAKQDAGDAFAAVRRWDDPPALPDGHTALYAAPLLKDGAAAFGVSVAPHSFIAIPDTCSDPLMVMDYLNIRSQAGNIVTASVGDEGTHYELGDGEYLPLPGFSEWTNAPVFQLAVPPDMVTEFWLCSVRTDEVAYGLFTSFNQDMESIIRIDPVSYAPPMEDIGTFKKSLDAFIGSFLIQVFKGEKTLEEDYDRFVSTWKADGGDIITGEYSQWMFGAPQAAPASAEDGG